MSTGYQHRSTPTGVGGAPSGPAGGELAGTYPNPTVAVTHSGSAHLAIGVTGTTAAAGNDSRLSDSRTPTAHATTHNAGGTDALAIDAAAATGSLRTLGTGAQQAAAGTDSRFTDSRTPTAHASTHIGSTTGEGSAAAIGTDPMTLISYVVRELIVEDEPFVLDSGKVCIVGSDNTALLWLDSGSQDVRSPVTIVQYQIYLRDEPFVLGPNELCILGDTSGRGSIWCDANQMWDRTGNGFSTVTELNADNLFVIASGDVWEVPADSPIMRHRDPVLVDSAILWIQ